MLNMDLPITLTLVHSETVCGVAGVGRGLTPLAYLLYRTRLAKSRHTRTTQRTDWMMYVERKSNPVCMGAQKFNHMNAPLVRL